MMGKVDRTGIYSLIQALYWMIFCLVIGYASVFLLERGFSATLIGLLLALGNILGALLQPLTADFADRTERLTLSQLIGGLGFLMMAISFWIGVPNTRGTSFLYVLLIALTTLLMPLVNGVGMYFNEGGSTCNYGVARAMGSLGFAGTSAFIGWFLQAYGASRLPLITSFLTAVLILVTALVKTPHLELSAEDTPDSAADIDSGFFQRYPGFFLVLAGVVLIFSFHNITSTYLIQMIRHVGGNEQNLGLTLGLAAVLELPAMIFFTRFASKISSEGVMKLAALFWIMKALAYVLAGSIGQIYGVQVLHGLSFAPFMPAIVYYSRERMHRRDQVKGQAMMTTANTLGGVIGNPAGGFLLDQAGVPALLLAGLGLTVAGAAAMIRGIGLGRVPASFGPVGEEKQKDFR
ncbi:MFS_1 like family protein [anaerobic digester metagenome]